MRADRLLSILLQLQLHGRLTSADLAKRLEVSQRTIHRDMESLGSAGVPVVAERGVGGGWSLMEGYRTDLTGLTDAEAQDVVQETMLSVAKQMPRFKYDPALGSFKGWLLQITRRRIADPLTGDGQGSVPIPPLIVRRAPVGPSHQPNSPSRMLG